MRCCYKTGLETLLTAAEFNGGASLDDMRLAGFLSRYPKVRFRTS